MDFLGRRGAEEAVGFEVASSWPQGEGEKEVTLIFFLAGVLIGWFLHVAWRRRAWM